MASPSQVTALTLNLLRDDGAVVYLNGQEVYRTNMPTGTIAYTTPATTAIGGADAIHLVHGQHQPRLIAQRK